MRSKQNNEVHGHVIDIEAISDSGTENRQTINSATAVVREKACLPAGRYSSFERRPDGSQPKPTSEAKMEIDLHGYHPTEIVFNGTLGKIVQQAWEMGKDDLTLIHGHGRNRGISPGFVNTNTGYFGLCIRQALRHDQSLRTWTKHTTLDCSKMGCTSIKLKANPSPTREHLDCLS